MDYLLNLDMRAFRTFVNCATYGSVSFIQGKSLDGLDHKKVAPTFGVLLKLIKRTSWDFCGRISYQICICNGFFKSIPPKKFWSYLHFWVPPSLVDRSLQRTFINLVKYQLYRVPELQFYSNSSLGLLSLGLTSQQ